MSRTKIVQPACDRSLVPSTRQQPQSQSPIASTAVEGESSASVQGDQVDRQGNLKFGQREFVVGSASTDSRTQVTSPVLSTREVTVLQRYGLRLFATRADATRCRGSQSRDCERPERAAESPRSSDLLILAASRLFSPRRAARLPHPCERSSRRSAHTSHPPLPRGVRGASRNEPGSNSLPGPGSFGSPSTALPEPLSKASPERPAAPPKCGEGHNRLKKWRSSMSSSSDYLNFCQQGGEKPASYAELRASGIDFPAAVVSELELNGYAIERVRDHGRLLGVRLNRPEPGDASRPPAPHHRRWPHR